MRKLQALSPNVLGAIILGVIIVVVIGIGAVGRSGKSLPKLVPTYITPHAVSASITTTVPHDNPQDYGNYLAKRYAHLGEQTLSFSKVEAQASSATGYLTIFFNLDIDSTRYMHSQSIRTDVEKWANSLYEDASTNWHGNFIIVLGSKVKTLNICSECDALCNRLEKTSETAGMRGPSYWIQTTTFATISDYEGSSDIKLCTAER